MHYLMVSVLFVLSVLTGVGALVFPCGAQGTSSPSSPSFVPPPPPIQNQPNQPPQAVPNATIPGQANAGSTSVPTAGIVGTTTSSSAGKTFGSVGRGLPGMTGGPPVNGPMGSQDPASKYMSPPTLPPVFCDPAVNIPC